MTFFGIAVEYVCDILLFPRIDNVVGGESYPFTAYDIVNSWEEENIADVLYGYAEERHSRRIAHAIVEARKQSEIKTTSHLVKIIEAAVPGFYKNGKIHPATKTFQAMRIAVNDELGTLE